MKYDKFVKDETWLNCKEQGYLDWLVEFYTERCLHEINLENEIKSPSGNLVGGFLSILIGTNLEEKKRMIELWYSSGYGYKFQLSDYSFRYLVKLAVNGELK